MTENSSSTEGTVIYIPHGGGPIPVLGGMGHERLTAFLQDLGRQLPLPEEILVISAHWEEPIPTVISSDSPGLLYDYYGFPQAAYEIDYPAPGNSHLADTIAAFLDEHGIDVRADAERGFDHGVFIPLKLIYPEANIPVTQLSLKAGLDPREHIHIGQALKGLMNRNILILGSGFSFHNMQAFSLEESELVDQANEAFQDWLIETCCELEDEELRERRLAEWTAAPNARYCHPREEHLLPLHVCQGIAGRGGKVIFNDYIVGKRGIAIEWP